MYRGSLINSIIKSQSVEEDYKLENSASTKQVSSNYKPYIVLLLFSLSDTLEDSNTVYDYEDTGNN